VRRRREDSMTRGMFILVAIGFMVGLATAQAIADDKEEEKAELREELDEQMEEKDWKAASKTADSLRRLLKGDEREELDSTILRIDGEIEWAKIKKAHDSGKKKPSKILKMLHKFVRKYGKDEEFLERTEYLERVALKGYVEIVEDFEESGEEEEDLEDRFIGRGARIVETPRKQGEQALKWRNGESDEASLFLESRVSDWSEYVFLSMWIHSETTGSRLTIDAMTDFDSYFECWNNIDWKGWKHIRIPIQGRGAKFGARGRPVWTEIIALRFWKDEGREIDIVIDDIRLEKRIP
jgi:hypothetical protein